jgi:hypothetical protein
MVLMLPDRVNRMDIRGFPGQRGILSIRKPRLFRSEILIGGSLDRSFRKNY